jgi:hypothetical protein
MSHHPSPGDSDVSQAQPRGGVYGGCTGERRLVRAHPDQLHMGGPDPDPGLIAGYTPKSFQAAGPADCPPRLMGDASSWYVNRQAQGLPGLLPRPWAALPRRPRPPGALGVLPIRRVQVALTRQSGLGDAERLIP